MASVSIFECLHSRAASIKAFLVDGKTKLQFSIAEKTSCLVVFCVKHINLHLFDGVALFCGCLAGSYLRSHRCHSFHRLTVKSGLRLLPCEIALVQLAEDGAFFQGRLHSDHGRKSALAVNLLWILSTDHFSKLFSQVIEVHLKILNKKISTIVKFLFEERLS